MFRKINPKTIGSIKKAINTYQINPEHTYLQSTLSKLNQPQPNNFISNDELRKLVLNKNPIYPILHSTKPLTLSNENISIPVNNNKVNTEMFYYMMFVLLLFFA